MVDVSIVEDGLSLVVGSTWPITADVRVVNGASAELAWTSSEPSIAEVDTTGVVAARAGGTTVVRATSVFDPRKHDAVTVRVVSAAAVPGAPATLAVFAGDAQVAVVGTAVPTRPSVIVRDAVGVPVPAVLVQFVVVGGGGTLTPAVPTIATDGSGVAVLTSWVLGTDPGVNALRAIVAGSDPPIAASLTAFGVVGNASPATSIVTVEPTDLVADGTATARVWVGSRDMYGNDLVSGGEHVQIDPPARGAIGAVVDHGDGTYSAPFTAGRSAGTVELTARVNGVRIVDAATLELTPWTFGEGRAIASTVGPLDYYNRHWVAVDGDTALVPVADSPYNTLYTRVDAYERDAAGAWVWASSLVPNDGSGSYTDVGRIAQLSGDTAAIVSLRNGVESVVNVFERDASGLWREQAVLLRGEGVGTAVSYSAGIAIALRDGLLVVGRPVVGEADLPVRVYARDQGGPGIWGLAAELPMLAAPIHLDGYLGTDVAVGANGDVIAVAKSVQNNDGGLGRGEGVFLYERRSPGLNAWDLVRTMRNPEDLVGGYSSYVEIDGSTLMVGHMPTVINPEVSVEFYERDEGGAGAWGRVAQREARLELEEGWITGYAHTSVRMVGGTAALGFTAVACGYIGPGDTPPIPGCGAGQVHVYGRDVGGAGAWGELQVLRSPTPFEGQRFGTAIDIATDEATVVVATSPVGREPGEADVFVFVR